MSKLKVAIIFGGKSTEHEISILSTKSILKQIDQAKYDLSLIKIDLDGNWFLLPSLNVDDANMTPVVLTRGDNGANILDTSNGQITDQIEIAFPVLHGTFGEDGTIQGLLKMCNVAFVGCGVFASSACMDKDFTKRLLRDAGIAIAPYITFTSPNQFSYDEVKGKLGGPLFVKPASLGSSVGVRKVDNKEDFEAAILNGFKYDIKVIVEPSIVGREIECAVMGNENPKASLPGEVVANTEFYSFQSKYVNKDGANIQIPVNLLGHQIQLIRKTAVQAFQALGCEGLARVDFFFTKDGTAMINEINTIPGFTNISMFPKMWEATGIAYPELLDLLIALALERFEKEENLITISPESL
jgi:D-alanine-D-alanine ligase